MLPIITEIPTLESYHTLLKNNPGLIIIKFGATWCGPCKSIENDVQNMFSIMPDNVQCVMIDIDKSFDFYSFMRKNRVLNGVPVIVSYNKNNLSFIPDDFIVGAGKDKLEAFKTRCLRASKFTKGIPMQKSADVLSFTTVQPQQTQTPTTTQQVSHDDQQDFNDSNFNDF